MKTAKELETLYNEYRETLNIKIKYKCLKENAIIDPNQTVEWNRQMVALQNEAYSKEWEARRLAINEACQKYLQALEDYLMNSPECGNGKITKEKLTKIKSFMHDWCEATYNYEDGFWNYIGLAKQIIKLIVEE